MLASAFARMQIAALFGTAILTRVIGIQFSGMLTPVSSLRGVGAIMGEAFPMTYFLRNQHRHLHQGIGLRGPRSEPRSACRLHPGAQPGESLAAPPAGAVRGVLQLSSIFWLGIKELRSFARDPVLVALVVWSFSFSIVTIAQSNFQELRDASIAIVDEDHSELSRRIAHAFLPPYFRPPEPIAKRDVDHR